MQNEDQINAERSLLEKDSSSTESLTNGLDNSNNSNSNASINNHLEEQFAQSSHHLENFKHDTPLPLTVHSGNTPMQSDSDSELVKSPSSKLFLLNSNGQLNGIENTF